MLRASRWLIGLFLLSVVSPLGLACARARPLAPDTPTAPTSPRCTPLHFATVRGNVLKLDVRLAETWRASALCREDRLVVILDASDASPADPSRMLGRLGASEAEPVVVHTRDQASSPHVTLTAAADARAWLVELPVDALPYVLALPWVERVSLASTSPVALLPDAEAARRVDPRLLHALNRPFRERGYEVGGLGKMNGCLTDERRRELEARAVQLDSVLQHPACDYTIFTFNTPVGMLRELASLPWIVKLEGGGKMHPE